ncbi:hypothetical protein [Maridesulfovibrio sp. FT414]|uniref:hypothetical protein n=1 Tax=Maridesulfovibrio sp. FT414 TaxID=2979469 RepID=UPI003D8014E7
MNPIIDLIIYAHDGRGLGHVSRSVAIGLAVRRLFPQMSVLLVTGCPSVAELVGKGDLDWIKLPSYRTAIVGGKSTGATGPSNLDDKILGELRARSIRHILEIYRPKVFLADHTPQGKHRELVPSHEVSPETLRVLGVRAVVGDVDKVWSDYSADIFREAYSNILWYGDSSVVGDAEISALTDRYGVRPYETGYVSRLAEMKLLQYLGEGGRKYAGVISIPWSGEGTLCMMRKLAGALERIGSSHGDWKIYMNLREDGAGEVVNHFSGLSHVSFAQVGPDFLSDLASARSALIYGGYNSLTDVMACSVPSVVLLRGMKDGEQEEHAAVLCRCSSSVLDVFPDSSVEMDDIEGALRRCLECGRGPEQVNLNGAEGAARYLADLAGISAQAGGARC